MREQLRAIIDVRTRRPQAIAEAAGRRKRRAALLSDDNQLFIIAADHPARGALRAGERPMAMADRAELLDRMSLALSRPGVLQFHQVRAQVQQQARLHLPGVVARVVEHLPQRVRGHLVEVDQHDEHPRLGLHVADQRLEVVAAVGVDQHQRGLLYAGYSFRLAADPNEIAAQVALTISPVLLDNRRV